MSDLAAEVATAIISLFVGGAVLWAVYAAVYGGDVSFVSSVISALAGPVIVLAVIAFIAVGVLDTLS